MNPKAVTNDAMITDVPTANELDKIRNLHTNQPFQTVTHHLELEPSSSYAPRATPSDARRSNRPPDVREKKERADIIAVHSH